MTAMLGFMALALDVGILFRARRITQIAADAAAVAGALDYLYNGSTTSATTAGKSASATNGATGIVGASMYDKASTIHINSYDAAHPTTTPNRTVTLVE
jgi:uncharacterized membrane protein